LRIAILVDVADDEVRCTMKSTILWPLVVGAVVALILVITAVSMSASGFQLDMERWVLIGAFLVVISMAAAAVVSALNSLKEVRERSTGDDRSNTSGGSS
jgi:cytochrome c biogenesis factor